MILISKVRMSVSKKINLMALFRTLTISTTTFKRMKEKFDVFRQTVCDHSGSASFKKWPNDPMVAVIKHYWVPVQGRKRLRKKMTIEYC